MSKQKQMHNLSAAINEIMSLVVSPIAAAGKKKQDKKR